MALIWALYFVRLCSVLHGPNLGISLVFVQCPPVLGLLDWCTARRFLLHGPNLGIVFVLFLFCALLCWVSFIGVLLRDLLVVCVWFVSLCS